MSMTTEAVESTDRRARQSQISRGYLEKWRIEGARPRLLDVINGEVDKLMASLKLRGRDGRTGMKFGALLGALVALAFVTSASATVRIQADSGGRIDTYLDKYLQIRQSGERVVIDGACNSACTLLLGTIPRDRVCVTGRASLGFHAAWQHDGQGRPVGSPAWTRVLWHNYPQRIHGWISRHGGLTPRMIFLRGRELTAYYPACAGSEFAGGE